MGRLGNLRYDARRDEGEKEIVDALEKCGFKVWRKLPVDLVLWSPRAPLRFDVMEIKAPDEKLVARPGPQQEFVDATGCPIVNDPLEAVRIAMQRLRK